MISPLKYKIYKGKGYIKSGKNEEWLYVRELSTDNWLPITQKFGRNDVSFYAELGMKGHNGIDYKAPRGSTLYAPEDGVVTWARTGYGEGQTYDNAIEIWTTDKKHTHIFGHLSEVFVKAGEEVKQGQIIGLTGNTGGYTSGPHLHWGWRELFKQKQVNMKQWWYDNKYYWVDNGFKGYIDQFNQVDQKVWEVKYPDNTYIQRTDKNNGGHGEVYYVHEGELLYLNSDKNLVTRQIPLVNHVLENYMYPSKIISTIKESEFNKIKNLEL